MGFIKVTIASYNKQNKKKIIMVEFINVADTKKICHSMEICSNFMERISKLNEIKLNLFPSYANQRVQIQPIVDWTHIDTGLIRLTIKQNISNHTQG